MMQPTTSPQLIGRYQVLQELGRGGMSTVYRAYDPRFKREVAIKVLPPEMLHDPTFRQRFEREAQTIAALEYASIVPVYDFGEENGQPFLVMRYMTGGSLEQKLQKGGLELAEASRILTRLAPGLDKAHERGIIHRDLKPGNILFDEAGDPYISDFGIVKLTEATHTLTGTSIVGTPAYMSPEQGLGDKDIDGRSDIYALGCILFHMLSGKLPYEATTPYGMTIRHMTEPVPNLLEISPGMPIQVQQVLERAMAKDRTQRFPTAGEMAQALARVISLGLAADRTVFDPYAKRHPDSLKPPPAPQPPPIVPQPREAERVRPAPTPPPAQQKAYPPLVAGAIKTQVDPSLPGKIAPRQAMTVVDRIASERAPGTARPAARMSRGAWTGIAIAAVFLGLIVIVVLVAGLFLVNATLSNARAKGTQTEAAIAAALQSTQTEESVLAQRTAAAQAQAATRQAKTAATNTAQAVMLTQAASTAEAQATQAALDWQATQDAAAQEIKSTQDTIDQFLMEAQSLWYGALYDDFTDNQNGWPLELLDSERVYSTKSISNGVYSIHATAKQGVSHYLTLGNIYSDFYLAGDVNFDVRVINNTDPEAGLIFRKTDAGYYTFSITTAGTCWFGKFVRSVEDWTELYTNTSCDPVNPTDANHLAVIAQGSRFVLFVNYVFIAEVTDTEFDQGEAGFILFLYDPGDETVFNFDNFEVRQP